MTIKIDSDHGRRTSSCAELSLLVAKVSLAYSMHAGICKCLLDDMTNKAFMCIFQTQKGRKSLASDVPRMPAIELLTPLFPSEGYVSGVLHNDNVSLVLVRCIGGLVLTLQDHQLMKLAETAALTQV